MILTSNIDKVIEQKIPRKKKDSCCQRVDRHVISRIFFKKYRHDDLMSSLPVHIYLMEDVDAVVAAQARVRGQGIKWRVRKALNDRKLP